MKVVTILFHSSYLLSIVVTCPASERRMAECKGIVVRVKSGELRPDSDNLNALEQAKALVIAKTSSPRGSGQLSPIVLRIKSGELLQDPDNLNALEQAKAFATRQTSSPRDGHASPKGGGTRVRASSLSNCLSEPIAVDSSK